MKKFATLFCALALVFGASTAQTAHKALAPQRASRAVEQVQKVQLEQAKPAVKATLENAQLQNLNQFNASKALKVNGQKAQTTVIRSNKLNKAQAPIARRSALNAKSVVKSAPGTAITIGDFSANTYEGEYYVVLTDAASTAQFIFDIDISANPFELGKTYTIADMVEGYTGIGDAEDWYAWTTVTDASYTETKDQDGLTHVVASMTDEDGNVYDLTYDQPEPQSKTIVASDFSMEDYGTDMYMALIDSIGNKFYFDVYYTGSFEYGKPYTLADMDPDYSWYKLAASGGYKYTEASITVTEDQDELLHVAAAVVLSNGDSYEITYDEKAFVPTGVQINVNATNYKAEYISYYGEYVYTASNEDFDINIWVYTDTELGTFDEDVDIEGSYLQEVGGGDYVIFHSVATPIVVAQDEDGNKSLTGSLYDKNGDEYVFNLTYEKPDAKEININVANADLNTKTLTAGFWTIDGTTADKNNSFNIYFISKGLLGTFTDVEQFDAYSTWVSDKSTGSNVYYENLSAVNLTSAVVGDSLKITGTMNLADYNGNEAIVTVYITTPFAQEWGEWADFAPFDVNTGKYAFSAALSTTQTNMPVQVRKDNTGLKQYKFIGWGKQVFTANGIDLLVDMAPDYSCTIAEQSTGSYKTSYGEYLMISDMNTYIGSTSYSSTYNPETGVFQLPVIYYISLGNFGYGYETMTMDQPISERDTVKVTADMKIAAEPANGIIKVSAELEETTYILEVVGTDTVGTFSLANGTLSQRYYYGIVSASGRSDFAEGEVTIAKNETGLKLDGLMIGVDEKAYVLDWTYTPITERDTVKVNLKAINVQEDVNSATGAHRGWLYVGVDTEAQYIVQVLGNEQLGTFSYAAGTLGQNYYNVIALDGSSRQQFTEGEVTIVEDEEGVKLNGLFIGEDEKAYVLNWIQPAGILQYDTDAPFDATFAWSDMEATIEDGVIGIYATNADMQTFGLELYTDPALSEIPAGTYVISDSKEAGTALQSVGVVGGYLTECWAGNRAATGGIDDCWFIVEGTVTLSYDEYDKLKVVVDGKNSWGQPVSALVQYEKLQPKDTVIVNDASLSVVEDYMEEMGIVYFYCEGTEHAFDLYAYADTIFGNFTNIDYRDCGYYSIDGDSASILDVFELNVSAEGKNMTLKAQVLTSDTILYVVNATGYYGAFAFDTNADFNASFSTENMTTKTITRSKKSCKIISAVNEAGDSVSILFRTSQMPAAGTYEINYTESANTVIASDGDTFENVSLAARSKDGGDPDIWFMVSGTVTIDELGNITVNALNSYDKAVKFTINVPEPEYYLYNYYYGKYLGWNGSSTDKNKIAMMDESDRMAVTVTLTDAESKRFTTSVTATDDKAMYLSMGSGFNFHSGSPYAGEQDNGYWYKVKDITASSIEAEKVSEIEEGEFYIIVHNYNGYCALGGSVTDTDGNGKMRILGYKLDSADDMITLDRSDILPYVYRYVTADTPAMDPATSVKPIMQKADDSIFNVAGQRILNPSNGNIYIINGKKILFE